MSHGCWLWSQCKIPRNVIQQELRPNSRTRVQIGSSPKGSEVERSLLSQTCWRSQVGIHRRSPGIGDSMKDAPMRMDTWPTVTSQLLEGTAPTPSWQCRLCVGPRIGWSGWRCLQLGRLGQRGQTGKSFLCTWSHTSQDSFTELTAFGRNHITRPGREASRGSLGFQSCSESTASVTGRVVEPNSGLGFVAGGASWPVLTQNSWSRAF